MLVALAVLGDEPVSLEEVKAHLRVVHSSDDALIAAQIRSAREVVEANTGLSMVEAEYLWATSQDGPNLRFPIWPVSSVEAISATDPSGQPVTVTEYTLDADLGRVGVSRDVAWRVTSVRFTTGAVSPPESLKSAIKFRVQAEYEADTDSAEQLRAAANQLEWANRVNIGI